MSLDSEVRVVLIRALDGAESWVDVYTRLQAEVANGDEEQYRALVWAFGYHLSSPAETDTRAREGSPFGALFEFAEKRLPPKLANVPDEDVDIWASAFDEIDDARLRSRIGDLLWERKHQPRPDQRARAAVTALLELSEASGWEPMTRADGLVRALELTLALSDHELRSRTVAQMVRSIQAELSSDEDRPGIAFSLLQPLVELPPSVRPPELRELLESSQAKYGNDPHQMEAALDLLAEVVESEEAGVLRERQVQLWRTAAANAEGILRLAWLEHALDLARTHALKDEAQSIRSELGSITEEELDLRTVSAEVKVPTSEVERFIEAFIESDDWETSLTRFGAHGPPGGEPARVEREVRQQMESHPLRYLVRNIVVDPDSGTAIFHATDEVSQEVAATAQHRMFAARIWSVLAVDVLHRIEDKYGRPEHDALSGFFTTDFIDEGVADRIARAYELFWDGQADESAHLLAPRLEAVLREVARQLGVPIIREPIGNRPGGVRPLGELFHSHEGLLPTPGWQAYFFHLLSDPLGNNLRNVIGHGMRARISSEDAALLLHAACHLRLLQPAKQPPDTASPG